MLEQLKLRKKFTHKTILNYQAHLLLMARVQFILELLQLFITSLLNMSFYFHLTHVQCALFRFIVANSGRIQP